MMDIKEIILRSITSVIQAKQGNANKWPDAVPTQSHVPAVTTVEWTHFTERINPAFYRYLAWAQNGPTCKDQNWSREDSFKPTPHLLQG